MLNVNIILVLSRVQLFETLWIIAHQATLSMEFSQQEYFSGLPFLPPRELPTLGFEPISPASPSLQVEMSELLEKPVVLYPLS